MKGSTIITSYFKAPEALSGPTWFEWRARFDGDGMGDHRTSGFGKTERAAIFDLLDKAEIDLPQDAEDVMWARAGK